MSDLASRIFSTTVAPERVAEILQHAIGDPAYAGCESFAFCDVAVVEAFEAGDLESTAEFALEHTAKRIRFRCEACQSVFDGFSVDGCPPPASIPCPKCAPTELPVADRPPRRQSLGVRELVKIPELRGLLAEWALEHEHDVGSKGDEAVLALHLLDKADP